MKLAECISLKNMVFELDERVRYFGFLDNRQGMVMSELRNKDETHPGESQLARDLTFFKGAMASWSIYFGKVRYALVSHEAFMIIMIPVESGLLIVTAEASLPLHYVEKIADKIHEQLVLSKV